MAFTGIFWDASSGGGSDIHVLRGQTSRSLADLLQLGFDTGADPVPASKAPLPADVTSVVFTPIFNFTLAAHGISVNAGTGAVTTAALPAGAVNVPNFIVQATVTHTSAAAPNPLPPIPIRIHVHNAVTKVTLSPDPLTVRVGSNDTSFTLLADFDDGTVGDISWHPGVAWQPAAGVDLSVGADGALVAANPGKNVQVTATMRGDMGGGAWSAHVVTEVPWKSMAPIATLVPGSHGSTRLDLPNIVFLPDGFVDGEQGKFQALVTSLVQALATAPTTYPFPLLRPSMNFWTIFVRSREPGATALNALHLTVRTAGNLAMRALPIPAPPDPSHGIQSVENLLWQVGLPIRADHGVPLAAKKHDWDSVYGAAHTNGLTAAIYGQWSDLWDYTLALERDTAFGLATGMARPQVQVPDDGRPIGLHPFRTSRAEVDDFLNLAIATDSGAPVPVGTTWSIGKDHAQVVILCAGARRAGQEGEVIAANLVDHREILVRTVAGSHLVATIPYDVPAKASFYIRAAVAHEVGHSLQLGDEYGGRPRLDPATDLGPFWNLQSEAAVMGVAPFLDGGKIAWRWPRMTKVAVLQKKPDDLLGGNYRFTVGVGQGAAFAQPDILRLRGRPLASHPAPSPSSFEFIVARSIAAGDEIDVKLGAADPSIQVDDWPAGTLVYLPALHPTSGQELNLVDDRIESWITTVGTPLNRRAMACSIDEGHIQPAVNLPPGLQRTSPKYSPWIVGLYDGGHNAHCGVFHPSGACIMRHLQVATTSNEYPDAPYLFCGVCRYILVDVLDPTFHPAVEAEFQRLFSLT